MSIWPTPLHFQKGQWTLWAQQAITLRFRETNDHWDDIVVTHEDPLPAIRYPEDLIEAAFERFKKRLFKVNIVPSKFHRKDEDFEPNLMDKRHYIDNIILEQRGASAEYQSRETYTIEVNAHIPAIIITIIAPEGAIRAFDSLLQLFYAHTIVDGEVYTSCAPAKIKDAPAFPYRGLMLDISRNWIPPQDVVRTIDAMSLNKLNKLHLHATDCQSWPLEVPSLPHLARKGAYSASQIWSVLDLEEVQRCGLYHGVEVILEIDMPGHTGSIFHAYPNLVTSYNRHPWSKYAQEPPAGQLKLNSPDVRDFIEKLLHDLSTRITPFSTSFHIGGDEINKECYKHDDTIRSSDPETIKPILQKFMDHIISLVISANLTPHAWEDMLVDDDLSFPPQTIFHTWKPGSSLQKILRKNHYAIFGEANEWYLDLGFGTFLDPDLNSPGSPIKHPYPDWCPPYKNWRRILNYDPLKDVPNEKRHLVLGGEVRLWSELTDAVSLDFMLWPRAAAAAEMMWRGKGEVREEITRALAMMRERLVKMGVRAQVVQMEWGLRNRGECVL